MEKVVFINQTIQVIIKSVKGIGIDILLSLVINDRVTFRQGGYTGNDRHHEPTGVDDYRILSRNYKCCTLELAINQYNLIPHINNG